MLRRGEGGEEVVNWRKQEERDRKGRGGKKEGKKTVKQQRLTLHKIHYNENPLLHACTLMTMPAAVNPFFCEPTPTPRPPTWPVATKSRTVELPLPDPRTNNRPSHTTSQTHRHRQHSLDQRGGPPLPTFAPNDALEEGKPETGPMEKPNPPSPTAPLVRHAVAQPPLRPHSSSFPHLNPTSLGAEKDFLTAPRQTAKSCGGGVLVCC
ncbi:uncharacterized protein LY79DRAFT_4110 [Colletotrichum navitas]|uniref:Uncharacterized protein n=1 Tax=Colletotrichum navitas TaxID=681940 RepID=A0AAD8QCG9_9PEZI|nr:uncharacterized protein LY79DRAFT_4110 [Colletotrichum navitas]KAK1600022.1 hypothetical protein LY79DRAFT_4110 [Colletotrichum navitas]